MTTQTKSTGKKPTHRAYTVSGEGKDANWTPIGAGWIHKDGKGFNFQLEAIPVNGRFVTRIITEKAPTEGAAE